MAEIADATVSAEFVMKWTKELTEQFIRLRAAHDHLFTGARNSAAHGWRTILQKMGLEGKVSPLQAKKKWDNLKKKYKDCKCPGSGQGLEDSKPTAATWPWFVIMDEVLGRSHAVSPPVLIASIQDDRPGPSAAASVPEQGEEGPEREPPPKRKRVRHSTEEDLLSLLKEDMAHQRQAEERRGRGKGQE